MAELDALVSKLDVALAGLAEHDPVERGTIRLAVADGVESPFLTYRSDRGVVTLQLESASTVWLECHVDDQVFRDEIDLASTPVEVLVKLCTELHAGKASLVRGLLSRRPVGLRVRAERIKWFLPLVS